MNLAKSADFFDPRNFVKDIHILGCGAVGSTIAELLTRLGVESISLYDFDTVGSHNIVNQMFKAKDEGRLKVDALEDILKEINPDIVVRKFPKGWTETTPLSGYVFICMDKMDACRGAIEANKYNTFIKAMYDVRLRLTDGQVYTALWNEKSIDWLLSTMDFTDEEAAAATPVGACGTTLSVTPTVRICCSLAVSNFINTVLEKPFKKLMLVNAFIPNITAM